MKFILKWGSKLILQHRAAIAVIENHFASQYIEDLGILVRIGEELGAILESAALKLLVLSLVLWRVTAKPL